MTFADGIWKIGKDCGDEIGSLVGGTLSQEEKSFHQHHVTAMRC
jgi:hypothetical protein